MKASSIVSVAILAGGVGSRLGLPDIPKPMAPVNGRPFLSYLFDLLIDNDFREAVLCVGYKWRAIHEYFGSNYRGLDLFYSCEGEPLGTGGALVFALSLFALDKILILNGDSFCAVDFDLFVNRHVDEGVAVSILVAAVGDVSEFGKVFIDGCSKVVKFEEKSGLRRPGFVNAGSYVIEKTLLYDLPPGVPISIESELFPLWLERFAMRAHKVDSRFLDIGTPGGYAKAPEFLGGMT